MAMSISARLLGIIVNSRYVLVIQVNRYLRLALMSNFTHLFLAETIEDMTTMPSKALTQSESSFSQLCLPPLKPDAATIWYHSHEYFVCTCSIVLCRLLGLLWFHFLLCHYIVPWFFIEMGNCIVKPYFSIHRKYVAQAPTLLMHLNQGGIWMWLVPLFPLHLKKRYLSYWRNRTESRTEGQAVSPDPHIHQTVRAHIAMTFSCEICIIQHASSHFSHPSNSLFIGLKISHLPHTPHVSRAHLHTSNSLKCMAS